MNSYADHNTVIYTASSDDLSSILIEQSPHFTSEQGTTSSRCYSTPSRINCTRTDWFEKDWVLFPDLPKFIEPGISEVDVTVAEFHTYSVLSDHVAVEASSLLDIDQYVGVVSEKGLLKLVDGKIKRPPNAFILYRTAFRHVAENAFSTKSQQLVSKICGKSWLQESEHVKTWFQAQAMAMKEKCKNHINGQDDAEFCSVG